MKDFEIYFNRDEILNFENSVSKIMNNYDMNKVEIAKLQELKQLIISRISGMWGVSHGLGIANAIPKKIII